jgi:hypothetical protein
MSTGGWIFLVLTWSVITSLMVYCYTKVLKKNNSDDGKHYKMTDQDDYKKA